MALAVAAFAGAACGSDPYAIVSVTDASLVGTNRVEVAGRPVPPALNNRGDVACRVYARDEFDTLGASRPGVYTRRTGTVCNLGHPWDAADEGFGNETSLWAYAVNNLGWVAGGSHMPGSVPFIWHDANGSGYNDDGEMLVPDTSGAAAVVTHLNDAGQALLNTGYGGTIERIQVELVGGALVETGDRLLIAESGVPGGLDEAGNVCWSTSSRGYRWIDRNGDNEVQEAEVAALWNPIENSSKPDQCPAIAMNNLGQVLGWAYTPTAQGGKNHGFIWTDLNENDIQEEGETTLVSSNYFNLSVHCWDINDRGEVVGGLAALNVPRYAFIWDPQHDIRNVNDIASLSDPVKGDFWASQAHGINDFGEIALYGKFSEMGNSEYAALVSPRPRIESIVAVPRGVSLAFTSLTGGLQTVVQRSEAPGFDSVIAADSFTASSTSTNWVDAIVGEAAFYRLELVHW